MSNDKGMDWRAYPPIQEWLDAHIQPSSQWAFMLDASTLLDRVESIVRKELAAKVEEVCGREIERGRAKYDGYHEGLRHAALSIRGALRLSLINGDTNDTE